MKKKEKKELLKNSAVCERQADTYMKKGDLKRALEYYQTMY